jgi:predicted aminopeptidase
VAVETSGVRKWLRAAGDEKAGLAPLRGRPARAMPISWPWLPRRVSELPGLWRAGFDSGEKRAAKATAIERLRARYRQMRDRRWGGYDGYDGWFEAPINNAKLAATSIYNDLVPAFLRLFELCAGDYPRFYAAVKRLGALDRAERADALAAARTCG